MSKIGRKKSISNWPRRPENQRAFRILANFKKLEGI